MAGVFEQLTRRHKRAVHGGLEAMELEAAMEILGGGIQNQPGGGRRYDLQPPAGGTNRGSPGRGTVAAGVLVGEVKHF